MGKPLKILQITSRIPYPLNDGGNIATYHVTKNLSTLGHEVHLVSLNTLKHFQDPSVLSSIANVYSVTIDTTITLRGLFLGVFRAFPYNVARFKSAEFSVLLKRLIKKEAPDVIHIEGIYMALYIPALRKLTKSPIILRSHNIEHEIWQRAAENESFWLKKWYLRQLSKKIKNFELQYMKFFDGIIAITHRDAQFYKQQGYLGAITTISAGVDTELYHYSPPPKKELSLCFIGSMEWLPNIQGIQWFLKEVWPLILQQHPTISLHIAGKNMPDSMKHITLKGVHFYGAVPDAKEFMKAHAIMIVPLLSGGGMRLKIVEGMALGKCILSTSIGAEGIAVSNGKEILLADSPKAFLNQLTYLVNNQNQIEQLGQSAARLAKENYAWEKLVRDIENFYIEQL